MADPIYAAFFDYHGKLRIDAIKVLKRSDKQVWVKASQGTGYKSRLDAMHTEGDAIAVDPDEALRLRRSLLHAERGLLIDKIKRIDAMLKQTETPPTVTEAK